MESSEGQGNALRQVVLKLSKMKEFGGDSRMKTEKENFERSRRD